MLLSSLPIKWILTTEPSCLSGKNEVSYSASHLTLQFQIQIMYESIWWVDAKSNLESYLSKDLKCNFDSSAHGNSYYKEVEMDIEYANLPYITCQALKTVHGTE